MDDIRIYPDPVLRKKAKPVENIDGRVIEIADRMAEAMYKSKGIGLAAPQIGVPDQIIVVDIGEGRQSFINPTIVEGNGESVMEEGCLSLPTIEVSVKRRENVLLRAWDLNGKEMRLELSGFLARVYQHEIDHLHGILIIHHVSQLKRQLLIKKMHKDLKRLKEEESKAKVEMT